MFVPLNPSDHLPVQFGPLKMEGLYIHLLKMFLKNGFCFLQNHATIRLYN